MLSLLLFVTLRDMVVGRVTATLAAMTTVSRDWLSGLTVGPLSLAATVRVGSTRLLTQANPPTKNGKSFSWTNRYTKRP